MKIYWRNLLFLIFALCAFLSNADGQVRRELSIGKGGTFEIVNLYGKVEIAAIKPVDETVAVTTVVSATGKTAIAESEVAISASSGSTKIEVRPSSRSNRVDISLSIPERVKVKITTADGEVRVIGDLESIEVTTETGTIAADVPIDDVRYVMLWTESRPRFLADFELEKIKERSGGRFSVKGRYLNGKEKSEDKEKEKKPVERYNALGKIVDPTPTPEPEGNGAVESEKQEPKSKPEKPKTVSLNFTTARGIVLLNVPPNEVMSDLRERPLTEAAKAIIRSGDSLLMDAIRRASPKYFGDYTRTLPPLRREPGILLSPTVADVRVPSVKTATVRVTDLLNRSVAGLVKEDFEAAESGDPREVLAVRPTTSSVNLVLLLDVSGSIENYVNFIRKAARAFVDTVDSRDKVSIVLFNEDVKTLAVFSTDKGQLSRSLDTFDAGGGTAYYDAIGYTLTEVLRPLRGERTAIVVLSDGDDNRSFLPLDSLAGSIEESGALIYPLYVPTNLIAAAASDPNTAVDPLRSRYLSNDITSKADAEGRRLAQISGGVYYPITQLSQIQTAYDDIVVQLRTAYDVTFRSEISTPDGRPSPRLKIRTTKPNTFIQIRNVSTSNQPNR